MAHVHQFKRSDKEGYEICANCGTYHSTCFANPKSLYENNYWSHEHNRSTIDEQIYNLTEESTGISKIDKILQYVHHPKKTLLEIGCAPGIFLNKASKIIPNVAGIEPDATYIPFIKQTAGSKANIINGYFPEVSWMLGKFDYIVAMDVAEHVPNYAFFFGMAQALLNTGGTFIMMSPVILRDGQYRERDFIPHEHIWIYTEEFLSEYLRMFFKKVEFDRFITGHEIVICTR